MTETSRQYALAVFSLACEQDAIQTIGDCFRNYEELAEDVYLKTFKNPRLTKTERKAILKEIVKNEIFLHFLYVLIDNDRFELLHPIRLLFEELVRDMDKIMRVKVIARTNLDAANRQRLIKKLESEYHRQIELEETTDPGIIAGFRLVVDGTVIDETINRRLEDLKTNLKR